MISSPRSLRTSKAEKHCGSSLVFVAKLWYESQTRVEFLESRQTPNEKYNLYTLIAWYIFNS